MDSDAVGLNSSSFFCLTKAPFASLRLAAVSDRTLLKHHKNMICRTPVCRDVGTKLICAAAYITSVQLNSHAVHCLTLTPTPSLCSPLTIY